MAGEEGLESGMEKGPDKEPVLLNMKPDKVAPISADVHDSIENAVSYTDYLHVSDYDKPVEALMDQLRAVGTDVKGIKKLIGYLPKDIIEGKTGKSVEEIGEEFSSQGLDVLLLSGPESETVHGAIYVFHREHLQNYLNKYTELLAEEGWPLDAEEFVRKSARDTAGPNTCMHLLIDYAFADKKNLNVGGLKALEKLTDGAFEELRNSDGVESNEHFNDENILEGLTLRDVLNIGRFNKEFEIDVWPRCLHHKYEGHMQIRVTSITSRDQFSLIVSNETGKVYMWTNYALPSVDGGEDKDAKPYILEAIKNGTPIPEAV